MKLGAMEVFRSLDEAKAAGSLRGCAVVIGNLDGVHLGHQQLLSLCVARARSRGAHHPWSFTPSPERSSRSSTSSPMRAGAPQSPSGYFTG